MKEAQEKVAEFIELRSEEERLRLVCERAALHYERGQTVCIYLPDSARAQELDALLWTFRQDSFIPHVRLEEAEEPLMEPVVICGGDPGALESDVLIVAAADGAVPWLTRFPHVYDFAPLNDSEHREAARRRYAACRDAGYRMRFIKP
ncbi:MAG: DNA polymerase III subunit chi [Planctomycetota bacterium]|jgi:DNA polymerase-3 subunit chi